MAAGAINAIVGSGSLITFPALLAIGFPPITANVSNTVGLVFGNFTAVWGYRRELKGQGRRSLVLGTGTCLGAVTGSALLLSLPPGVFRDVVPALILLACALMAIRPSPKLTSGPVTAGRIAALIAIAYFVGIYGGYFGAAQGGILLAALRLLLPGRLQRLNGLKNVLAGLANLVAAFIFIIFAHINWEVAGLIAAGSIVGAALGASYRRLVPHHLARAVGGGGGGA